MKKTKSAVNFFLLLLAGFFLLAASSRQSGTIKKTSFAIVVDVDTYREAKDAIDAYRNLLESEGLHTHLLSETWKTPCQIREELIRLYRQQPPLEGAVFIGDIPIPMIRDGQHLTSAFKMDQVRFPFHRSSVPSDRFYDDFDLQFEYLHADEERPLLHYYSLSADSPQKLQTNIYSGRIKPPVSGIDKYEQIRNYLFKVVAERSKANPLDNAISFIGHGYNSECLVAWASERIALREQLPVLFEPGNSYKSMHFATEPFSKFQLMSELQRPELDMALLTHHGSTEIQFLDGYPNVSAIVPSIENVRRFLRSQLRRAAARSSDQEETMDRFIQEHGVPKAWFKDAFDPEVIIADSIFNANLDISIQDFGKFIPNARFVKFDACFNGAFHLEEYIAGSYIFSPGKTIVALANTVNVLQDNWPIRKVGLLAEGVRIGNWARHIQYLENHIIGDPTFRFAANSRKDWDQLIVRKKNHTRTWIREKDNPNPNIQALALTMLYYNQFEALPELLLMKMKSSHFGSVRMQALSLLRRYNDKNYIEALKLATKDPYELIRRLSVSWIGDTGREELLPALVGVKFSDRHARRVLFNAQNSIAFMTPEATKAELEKQFAESMLYHKNEIESHLMGLARPRIFSDLDVVMNPSAEVRNRISQIRTLRNYTYHFHVDDYVKIMSNPMENKEVRMTMIEALGWFTHSYNVNLIKASCLQIIENELEDTEIRNEALKTLNRLNTFSTPIRQ